MEEIDLLDEADDRLNGLFDDDPHAQRQAVWDVLERAANEPDLEDALLEALELSFSEWTDESQGTLWMVIIVGELRLESAVNLLLRGLGSEDELVVAAVIRSLRRIGEPAFDAILDELDDDAFGLEAWRAAITALEGVRSHDLPVVRDTIEERLIALLHRPVDDRDSIYRAEQAALSLARIGVQRSRPIIEKLHTEVLGRANAFLQEALDILEENPEGTPLSSDLEWTEEFRWASDADPGGELPDGVGGELSDE